VFSKVLIVKNIFLKLLKYEAGRFLLVGGSIVLVDLICYLSLMYFGFETSISKGISFCFGAILGYFANRNYTFQSSEAGFLRFAVFCMLYLCSLFVNVFSNDVILKFTNQIYGSIIIAFLIATLISATLNFIGMKYIIFKANN
jgi:putative flippase GtrA